MLAAVKGSDGRRASSNAVTHTTRRSGSPYTLGSRRGRSSSSARRKERAAWENALAWLAHTKDSKTVSNHLTLFISVLTAPVDLGWLAEVAVGGVSVSARGTTGGGRYSVPASAALPCPEGSEDTQTTTTPVAPS